MQNTKRKTKVQNVKLFSFPAERRTPNAVRMLVFLLILSLFIPAAASAAKITILYTGDTHAMIYPCSCAYEADGGVARRAALVKKIRRSGAGVLLLDSGGFFAGGALDEYSQNSELDKARTLVNLKAMELMGYDAACIGSDEFNFGKDFLLRGIAGKKTVFLSADIKLDGIKPYLVKEVAGVKIGIIGLSDHKAAEKSSGVGLVNQQEAIASAVNALNEEGAQVIILLSYMGKENTLKLLDQVPGIDIVIARGYSRPADTFMEKHGNITLLMPYWQGKRLGKISFDFSKDKISRLQAEELRLSEGIAVDPQVQAALPRCFRDSDCQKPEMAGTCREPGSKSAACKFHEGRPIELTVISPKKSLAADTANSIKGFQRLFPGLKVTKYEYPQAKARKLAEKLAIRSLPAYLFSGEFAQEENFKKYTERFEKKEGYYLLKPQFSGVSLFLDRGRQKGKVDLFISLFSKDSPQVLEAIRSFNPRVHFLASQDKDTFSAAKGSVEVEEDLRSVCVEKYFPGLYWDYLICRAKKINSSWWEDCLAGENTDKIKSCARGEEGKQLLKENIRLNKEIEVMSGPTYLVDNQEVFGTQGAPSEKELKRILKR
ncbi:MAG: hypothetical protein PHD09_02045 [Candidatus Omnitrophica bacterium]|nr:hypothetical protein [Candidatus Omnitrophota bacterium]